jgi:hypothetical protein
MKIRLCYRVEKEAGWGEDEYGNPTEVYSCVTLDWKTYNVPKEEYKELVKVGKELTAKSFDINKELITPVTLNEYLDNTEKIEECLKIQK